MLGRLFTGTKKDEAAKSTRPPNATGGGRSAAGDAAPGGGGGFFNLPPTAAKAAGFSNPNNPASYSTSPSTGQSKPSYGVTPPPAQQPQQGYAPSLLSYQRNPSATSPSPAPPSLFGGMHMKQPDAAAAPVDAPKPTSLFNGLDLGGSAAPAQAPLSLAQLNLSSGPSPTPAAVEPPVQKQRAPRPGTFNYLNVAPTDVSSTPAASMPIPAPAPIKKKKKPSFRPGFDRQSSEDTGSQRGDDDDDGRSRGSVLSGLTVNPVMPEVPGRLHRASTGRTGTTPTRTTARSSSSANDSLSGLLDQLTIVNVGPGAAGYAMPPPVQTSMPTTTPTTVAPTTTAAATPVHRKSTPSPRPSLVVSPAAPRPSSRQPPVVAPVTPEGRLVQLIRDYDATSKSFRDAIVQLSQEDARLVEKKAMLSRQLAQYALDLQSVEAQQLQAAEDEDFERADALNTTIGSVRHCIMLSQSDLRKAETDLAAITKQREKLMVHHVRTTKGVLLGIQKCEDDRSAAYAELSAAAKAYKATERRRFAFEQQRIATELHHVTVNMGHLEGEKHEIESSIASQCTAETEAQTRLLAEKASVEAEIAELEAKLLAARAHVTEIDAGLATADAGIQVVRHKFARQLKRLVEREKGILKTKKEIEADDLALGRQQEAFAAKKAGYSAEMSQLARDVLGVQKEVRIATIMVRLTDEQNARRDARDARVKKQETQLHALREAAQAAEQQFKLLGHQLDDLKKKLQTNRTVIMTAGTTLPQLETEKKAAAAERNFKEAARLSKDIKQLEKDRATAEEQIDVLGMEIKDIDDRIHVREDEFHAKQDELRDVEKNLDLEWLDVLYQVHVDLRSALRQLAKYDGEKWSTSDGESVDFRGVALTLVQMEFTAVVQEIEALEDKYNLEPHVAELPPEVPEKELVLLSEPTDDESVKDDDDDVESLAAEASLSESPNAALPLARSVSAATVGDLTTSDAIKDKIASIEAQIDEATENEDYELAARLDDELEEWNARLHLVEEKEGELKEKLNANDMHKQVEALQHKIEQLAEQIENATAEEEYELAAALDEELVAAQTQKTDLQLTLANLPDDEDVPPRRLSVQSSHLVEDNSDDEDSDNDDVETQDAPSPVHVAEPTPVAAEPAPVASDEPVAVQQEEAPAAPTSLFGGLSVAPTTEPAASAPSLFGGLSLAPTTTDAAPAPVSLFGGLSIAPTTTEPTGAPVSLFGGLNLASTDAPVATGGSLFGGLVVAAPTEASADALTETKVEEESVPADEALLGGDYVMPSDAPSASDDVDDDEVDDDEDGDEEEYDEEDHDAHDEEEENTYMAQEDTPMSAVDEIYMEPASSPVAVVEQLDLAAPTTLAHEMLAPVVAPLDEGVASEPESSDVATTPLVVEETDDAAVEETETHTVDTVTNESAADADEASAVHDEVGVTRDEGSVVATPAVVEPVAAPSLFGGLALSSEAPASLFGSLTVASPEPASLFGGLSVAAPTVASDAPLFGGLDVAKPIVKDDE